MITQEQIKEAIKNNTLSDLLRQHDKECFDRIIAEGKIPIKRMSTPVGDFLKEYKELQ